MAAVYAVVLQKGGGSKSMTAIQVAHALSLIDEEKVLLVDGDVKDSASTTLFGGWRKDAGLNSGPEFLGCNGKALTTAVRALHDEYDYIVIDTSHSDRDTTYRAMLEADVVLITLVPEPFMVARLGFTLDLFDAVREKRPEVRLALLFTRVKKISRDQKDAMPAVSRAIEAADGYVLVTRSHERTILSTQLKFGRTAADLGNSTAAREARDEIVAITRELKTVLEDRLPLGNQREFNEQIECG